MRARHVLLMLVVLGLAAIVSPVVGSASAEVCRVGDVDCYERKVRCVVRTVTDPTDPPVCTA